MAVDPDKYPTEAFIDSMGNDWWANLAQNDKVEYHGKIIAENWNTDWKVLTDTVVAETDLTRGEVMLFMILTRVDKLAKKLG
jgi:hypothetical protein